MPGNGDTEKLALSATHSWTRTHWRHEKQRLTSCSSRPSLGRFLYLLLHSRTAGHPRQQPPAPGRPGKPALPDQSSEGVTLSLDGPDKPADLVSHAGFLGLRPAGPRPSSSRTPAARPAEAQAPALGKNERPQLAETPFAPQNPETHLLSPRPDGRLAPEVSVSAAAVLFPTRIRGPQSRSSQAPP